MRRYCVISWAVGWRGMVECWSRGKPAGFPPPNNPSMSSSAATTSERQVSLMSGTNVWLKLRRSDEYAPRPFLLDRAGDVWALPYALTLRHTVEEVAAACEQAVTEAERLAHYRTTILADLRPDPALLTETDFVPRRMTLDEFIADSPLVFIALHGGIGENGELQAVLQRAEVAHSGSGAVASRLCMDKYATGQALAGLAGEGITTAGKVLLVTGELVGEEPAGFHTLWHQLQQQLTSDTLILKPSDDGCSSGVVRLASPQDLGQYVAAIAAGVERVPPGTFALQSGIVEMPAQKPAHLLAETFIETDEVRIVGDRIEWQERTGWIEVTVGVVGTGRFPPCLDAEHHRRQWQCPQFGGEVSRRDGGQYHPTTVGVCRTFSSSGGTATD